MKVHPRLSRRSGVTLIEVLVSLAIVTVIVVAIVGGLHFGRRAWERPSAIEEREGLDAAVSGLIGMLERTYPARVADTRQLGALVFSGEPDQLTFVTLSEGETQYGGLVTTRLSVNPKENTLLIQTRVFRPQSVGGRDDATAISASAIENVTAVAIRYFGATPGTPNDSWQDHWNGRDTLPKLISLRLLPKGGQWSSVPPIVVAIRMS